MIAVDALQKLLCERLCEEVRVDVRPDGELMLRTTFEFPDGDNFPIHLSEAGTGGIRLSDLGHTLMHISYEHNIDAYLDGTRGMILERIIGETGVKMVEGVVFLDTSAEKLPEAIFNFGQALTRIYDLTLLSRSNVGSTFYDDLEDLLFSVVDESKVTKDFHPNVANADSYSVDYKIDKLEHVPLFLYGIPNRDKARLTTIMLSHFHRNQLNFESILVFENQEEIPRTDLARLSDVGGEMVSSLASREDFSRKLTQNAA